MYIVGVLIRGAKVQNSPNLNSDLFRLYRVEGDGRGRGWEGERAKHAYDRELWIGNRAGSQWGWTVKDVAFVP